MDATIEETVPKELCLFSKLPFQTAVLKKYFVDTHPISNIGTGPIEFHISGQSADYIDLDNSRLYVKLRIVKADGTHLTSADKVGFINAPLHSLWNQIDVAFQGKTMSSNTGNHGLRSYITMLLNNSQGTKEFQLSSALYYQDTAGEMDATGMLFN